MPDGNIAICYAEAVANGVAKDAYPHGFEHHYYNPERIAEPRKLKRPARIFIDSMSDLFGAWVPEQQIKSILSICAQCDWHTFLVLTKNAPRLLKFADQCPDNLQAAYRCRPTLCWASRCPAISKNLCCAARFKSLIPCRVT